MPRLLRKPQQGAAAVIVALWMGVALSCLMVLDIGNFFWQKREIQKIADLAALAGAGQGPDSCGVTALADAHLNGYRSSDTLLAQPGHWEVRPATASEHFFVVDGPYVNACRVQITRDVPYFFAIPSIGGHARQLVAQATALKRPNVARVVVRSSLLGLDTSKSALLNAVVGGLLGGKINLNVLSWEGIANANVELLKFLDALAVRAGLQVGNYEQILAAPVSLGQLTLAMADALPRSGNAVAIAALETLAVQVGSVQLALGELLKLGTGMGSAALEAGVNALDLLTAMAQLANSKQAAGVDVELDLLLAKVRIQLKIIEPPQSHIGDPAREEIAATTSQLKLGTTIELGLPYIAEVALQLGVELGQGRAAITGHSCQSPNKSVRVVAQSGVGTVTLSGEVAALGLLKIPLNIVLPLVSHPKQMQFNAPHLPRLDDLGSKPNWQSMSQGNLVESLITALTNILGPLGTLLGAVLSPVAALLDAVVNLLLGVLGVSLGGAEVGTELSCNPQAELVF